jgi:hypothetical protein
MMTAFGDDFCWGRVKESWAFDIVLELLAQRLAAALID